MHVFARWFLNNHCFWVSLRFYLFIEHPLAGCACFCAFRGSISIPLAFLCSFACLLTILQLVCMFLYFWLPSNLKEWLLSYQKRKNLHKHRKGGQYNAKTPTNTKAELIELSLAQKCSQSAKGRSINKQKYRRTLKQCLLSNQEHKGMHTS